MIVNIYHLYIGNIKNNIIKDFSEELVYCEELIFNQIELSKHRNRFFEILMHNDSINFNEKLIFYFSDNSCYDCVKKEISNLEKLSHILEKRVIIVGSIYDVEKAEYWINELKTDFMFINIGLHKRHLFSIDPFYCFVQNINDKKGSFYRPHPRVNKLTENYFEYIFKNGVSNQYP